MTAASIQAASLHERLALAAAGRSCGQVARLTHTHPETARRYLRGQSPSVEFVVAFAEALNLSLTWLLLGRGPMHGPRASEPMRSATLLDYVDRSIDALAEFKRQAEASAQRCECVRRPLYAEPDGGVNVEAPVSAN